MCRQAYGSPDFASGRILPMVKPPRQVAPAFLVLGFAFIAIGASRQRALVAIGIVFLVLGILQMKRQQRP